MSTFYGFDLIVHRWDIATGAGIPAALADNELEILEAVVPTFGEHLYGEGVCKGPLPVGPDADRATRILGVLGRVADSRVDRRIEREQRDTTMDAARNRRGRVLNEAGSVGVVESMHMLRRECSCDRDCASCGGNVANGDD